MDVTMNGVRDEGKGDEASARGEVRCGQGVDAVDPGNLSVDQEVGTSATTRVSSWSIPGRRADAMGPYALAGIRVDGFCASPRSCGECDERWVGRWERSDGGYEGWDGGWEPWREPPHLHQCRCASSKHRRRASPVSTFMTTVMSSLTRASVVLLDSGIIRMARVDGLFGCL